MTRAWLCLVASTAIACIKAPAMVVVDRATALEQQAGASFPEMEKKLAREAVSSRPVALTPDQLEAQGVRSTVLDDDMDATDAERLDEWLVRRCVGEASDGLLVDTSDACHASANHDELVKLVDRANRGRTQVWRWMHEQRPNVSIEDLRKEWRIKHAAGVTCGAWVQDDAGHWSAKRC